MNASHSPKRICERHCLDSVYNTSVAHLTRSGLVSNSNYEDSVFFIIFGGFQWFYARSASPQLFLAAFIQLL